MEDKIPMEDGHDYPNELVTIREVASMKAQLEFMIDDAIFIMRRTDKTHWSYRVSVNAYKEYQGLYKKRFGKYYDSKRYP